MERHLVQTANDTNKTPQTTPKGTPKRTPTDQIPATPNRHLVDKTKTQTKPTLRDKVREKKEKRKVRTTTTHVRHRIPEVPPTKEGGNAIGRTNGIQALRLCGGSK
jgi:hypothetical protein